MFLHKYNYVKVPIKKHRFSSWADLWRRGGKGGSCLPPPARLLRLIGCDYKNRSDLEAKTFFYIFLVFTKIGKIWSGLEVKTFFFYFVVLTCKIEKNICPPPRKNFSGSAPVPQTSFLIMIYQNVPKVAYPVNFYEKNI